MYKTLKDALKDGWEEIPSAFATRYRYFTKLGYRTRRLDELVEGTPEPTWH